MSRTEAAMSRDVFLLLLGTYSEYNMKEAIDHDTSLFPSEGWAYLCTQGRSWASMVCMLSVFTLFVMEQSAVSDATPPIGRLVIQGAALLSYVGVVFFLVVSLLCESVILYATYREEMDVVYGPVLYGLTTALFAVVNILLVCATRPSLLPPSAELGLVGVNSMI